MLTKNIKLEKQRSRIQGAPSLWSGQTDTDIILAKNNGTNPASIIWMRPSLVRPGRHRSTCNNRNSEIQRAPLLASWWQDPANRHQKSCNVTRWPRSSLWAVVPRGARYRVGHTQTGTLMRTSNTDHQQFAGYTVLWRLRCSWNQEAIWRSYQNT